MSPSLRSFRSSDGCRPPHGTLSTHSSNSTASLSDPTMSMYGSSSILGPHATSPFKVLIVGAGIGGLTLAYCLQRAGIDFVVLERAQHVSLMSKTTIQLTANTLHVIEQLGLLDEVMRVAKPVSGIKLMKYNMTQVGKMDTMYCKDRYGHHSCIVPRTEFCQLLLSLIPTEKVLWNRYVLEVVSGNAGVQCRCSNGHVEQADILVGADGAYSAVRQNLYRTLREKGLLPKSDQESLKFTQNAILGLTNPLDIDRYPAVGARFCEANIVVGKDCPYTLWLSPVIGNRVAWSVTGELLTPEDDENFKQSGFGPEAIDAACAMIQDLEIPYGGTLADIIAQTKRDHIIKAMVEEKHYKTWQYGRTVLVGEACHKFMPFSGMGAEQAILDVVCLVNMLHKLGPESTHQDFCGVFEAYQERRGPSAKSAIAVSNHMSQLMSNQGITSELKRKFVFNMPAWVLKHGSMDKMQVRPLLDFLPKVGDRGSKSVKVKGQPGSSSSTLSL